MNFSWINFVIIYFYLIAQTECLGSFRLGETIRWQINLSNDYPRGIFCSRLEAYLIPTASFSGESTKSLQEMMIARSENRFHDLSIKFPFAVEVGIRYELTWTIQQPMTHLKQFNIQIFCLEPTQRSLIDSFFIHRETTAAGPLGKYLLAESEDFLILHDAGTNPTGLSFGNIKDISRLEFYIDNTDTLCKISFAVPALPVIDDYGIVIDMLQYLKYLEITPSDSVLDSNYVYNLYRSPMSFLRFDEQTHAKYCKFSENMRAILTKYPSVHIDDDSNINTKTIYKNSWCSDHSQFSVDLQLRDTETTPVPRTAASDESLIHIMLLTMSLSMLFSLFASQNIYDEAVGYSNASSVAPIVIFMLAIALAVPMSLIATIIIFLVYQFFFPDPETLTQWQYEGRRRTLIRRLQKARQAWSRSRSLHGYPMV